MVDERVADLGERQPAQLGDGLVGRHRPARSVVDQPAQRGLVHAGSLWRRAAAVAVASRRAMAR